jgi:SNF2 family DNA or RNA helicase
MQISRSSPRDDEVAVRPGDLVEVRRARWRIVEIRACERCRIVTLRGVSPTNVGIERRVLAPFDIIESVASRRAPRFVRPARWRHACRALIAADTPPGSLRAGRSARIDLLPYQLEPALAVLRGAATRLLLADEVGLGKTIQAGLIAAELLARGAIERILVLTPAGLRDQWARELAHRFAIHAMTIDGPLLRRLATTLPIGVNPWLTIPLAVASIDYVKRAEVLPAVSECPWDLVIVDEAHGVAGDSDRYSAAQALTTQAAYVLLLTATPHSGDRHAFASLCDLGAVDATPLVAFRRTRAGVGIGIRRRVHAMRIRPNAAELRMHALLARYGGALRAERRRDERRDPLLALSVLHKRAFSSAWSLAQSVERRLTSLAAPDDAGGGEQFALPLGDPTGDLVRADEPPSWPDDLRMADRAHERRLLTALLSSAGAASIAETKLRRLDALLRRTREPAVVFTEYRDTLTHVQRRLTRPTVVLHGGLTRDERANALAAFAATPMGVLLATDAAAEGLNLHGHCRLVINLELPWNPMRLEQRIGRVDRIGQRRAVHAFHLIADHTGELRILDRLRSRVAAAGVDIGVSNPLGNDDEQAVARLVITGADINGIDDGGSPGGRDR